jgi:hypothetical protein
LIAHRWDIKTLVTKTGGVKSLKNPENKTLYTRICGYIFIINKLIINIENNRDRSSGIFSVGGGEGDSQVSSPIGIKGKFKTHKLLATKVSRT